MQIISLDCETFPIRKGLAAPPAVCFGWCRAVEGDVVESGLVTDFPEHVGDLPPDFQGPVTLETVFEALANYALALGPAQCRFVNQNTVFDFATLGAMFPNLLPLIFAMYDAGIVEDPMLREQLIDIARGSLNWSSEKSEKTGKNKRKDYSLQTITKKWLGIDLDKSSYRLGYGFLSKKALAEWDQGAIDYGIDDAIAAALSWFRQRDFVISEGGEDGEVPDSRNQAKYHWGLHLMSCWGLRTDPKMVFSFKRYLQRAFHDLQIVLGEVGLIREGGRKNMKAICDLIVQLSAPSNEFPEGIPVKHTPKGRRKKQVDGSFKIEPQVSTKAEHVEDLLAAFHKEAPKDLAEALKLAKIAKLMLAGVVRPTVRQLEARGKARPDISDHYDAMLEDLGFEQWTPELDKWCADNRGEGQVDIFDALMLFAWYTSVQKLLGTYIPPLEVGTRVPINVRYRPLMETGRTSASAPNIQNLPKAPGVRECYIPRPGFAFCSVDYEALELHTLAEVCLELLGESALADALNAGLDPHLMLACEWLLDGVSYEEGKKIRKDENHPRHKEVVKARNLAKAANFGLPGGLGAQKFVDFCKASGIIITLDEAKALKQAWLMQWPEMRRYFEMIASMLQVDEEGLEGATLEQVYSHRIRGKARYTAAANSFFQGLAADGAKDACYELVKACYLPDGELYGSRLVVFIHDETIMEHPMLSVEDLHRRCFVQARIMIESMQKFCRRVKPKAVPALMMRWYKDAVERYNEEGFLVAWKPKEELVWN